MSDYTKSTNFAAKDALASGNAAKVVKGTEIDTEFNNIATAIATKTDDSSAAITGGTIDGTAIGGTTPAAGAFTTLSASGVSSFADGTASAPAITNTGDTNTGIFFPAADTVAFATNGTEDARFDSAGNFGLGVTPSAWGVGRAIDWSVYGTINNFDDGTKGNFQVGYNYYQTNASTFIYKVGDLASMYRQRAGVHSWYTAASGTAGNAITFTQAMTLDASGQLGIGTTSPAAKIEVSGSGNNILSVTSSSNGEGTLYLGCQGTGAKGNIVGRDYLTFHTTSSSTPVATGTERARIDSSGNLLVGTTNSANNAGTGLKFSANGLAASVIANSGTASDTWNVYNTTAGAFRFYVTNGGTIFATSTTISAISDERLKENIKDIDTGLDAVMALKPRRFDWKEGKGQDKKNAAGFIAQEFETVFPDSVATSKAGEDGIEYKNICHEELIPTLVKAIQEQQAIIETLTNRITALEAK